MTDKLSYDIISLVALIDCVKRAADRYIQNTNLINNIELGNIPVANDINEMVSDLGAVSSDQFSPIVAIRRSGLGTLTGLVNPIGSGNLSAMLQIQGGANISSGENVNSSPLDVEYCVTAPSLLPIPSERRAPNFVQFDSFDGTTYFSGNNTVGVIIREVKEPRLAIEGDIHLSSIPSASLCLSDFQHLSNDV